MAKLIACLGVLAVLLSLLVPASARAAGRIEVVRGALLELRPSPTGTYEATFDVRNVGEAPLFVSRIAPRTDADDVRLPRRLLVRFDSGQTSGTIPPHGVARARIVWTPDRDTHLHGFYGHVMITSTDESAGEVAVGFAAHAGPLGALGRHVLSAMTLLPLASSALLALIVVSIGGGRTGRRARVVALVATLGCAALALLAWGMFDPDLSRADGGEGFQLVERTSFVRGLGMEIFLGVDGASLPLVVVCALAAPCGVLASWEERQNPSVFFACYLLLVGASLGALVALDGALFFGCLGLALTATFLLVGLYDRAGGRVAGRMLVLCGLGLVLVGLALAALHAVPSRAFLVDGSPISHTWAFPELARIDFVGSRQALFGVPLAKCAFVLSFVGLALCAALFPFHVWLAPVLRSAPPAAAMMVCVGFTRAAMLGLMRIDVVVLPEAARSAAPVLCTLGAAGTLYGASVAIGSRQLAAIAAFGLVSMSGVALVGVGSLTPQALLGAMWGIAASGCAAGAVLIVLSALRERIGTLDVGEIRGLAIEAPLLAGTLGIAALSMGAVPGSAGFWATCLVEMGAVVREPLVAAGLGVGAVLLAVSQALPVIRSARGRLPEALRRGEALTPYGGHVPDLRVRELAAVAPLLLLILLLGFYPAPLLARAQATARDMDELVNPKGPLQVE